MIFDKPEWRIVSASVLREYRKGLNNRVTVVPFELLEYFVLVEVPADLFSYMVASGHTEERSTQLYLTQFDDQRWYFGYFYRREFNCLWRYPDLPVWAERVNKVD